MCILKFNIMWVVHTMAFEHIPKFSAIITLDFLLVAKNTTPISLEVYHHLTTRQADSCIGQHKATSSFQLIVAVYIDINAGCRKGESVGRVRTRVSSFTSPPAEVLHSVNLSLTLKEVTKT